MTVQQVYELMNTVTTEVLGESTVVQEDLSNVIDIGTEIFNANAVDNYVRSLVNHIGRVIFVNRPYSGNVVSVLREGWEFGSVLEKVTMDLPEATENESWELTDKTSYDPNIFYKPTVTAKFFNKKITFEVPISITERQVKESFSNVNQLNSFLSMIYNAVDRSMTVKTDSVVMRLLANMIAETYHADYAEAAANSKSGIKAVNLLYKYNQKFGTEVTKEQAITTPEFLRFAAYEMGKTSDRMKKLSTLFNIGGKDRFTPRDLQHIVLLSEFARAADSYLYSDTYHNEFVRLPQAEVVPYWQGSGTDYEFSSTSAINVKTADGNEVTLDGILGIMFDHDAVMVCNEDRRTTTNYNPKAEFYNNWYKWDCSLFSDFNENFIVFFIA